MKKSILLFSLYSFLFSLNGAFAYTSSDVSNATYLADQGIITKQSNTSKYRLDDTITRAEAVGIALKIKGVTLPDNYVCRNYFTDVRYDANNNWKCRAIEIAADQGIISRSNAKFRPSDTITRAESLAIVYKASGLKKLPERGGGPGGYKDVTIQWQKELFLDIIDSGLSIPGMRLDESSGDLSLYYYYPNRSATRSEVFGFGRNIINKEDKVPNPIYDRIFSAHFGNDFLRTEISENIYFGFGDKVGAEGSLEYRYSVNVFDKQRTNLLGYLDKIEGIGEYRGKTFYIFRYSGICSGNSVVFFGLNKFIKIDNFCQTDIKKITQQLEKIDFDLLEYRLMNSTDIFKIYYQALEFYNTDFAYQMRSPAGVSLETFQSWYKDVTAVSFREDTLRDLGNNTYEFLIDMIEKGVTSTYKVKSKVNLENFTIDNISSVKQ